MKQNKDNMLGLPLAKKVEMFFSLDLTQADLERLSGVNENAIMVLSRAKGELFKSQTRSVTVETAEKIETVVNKFVHEGKFENVDKNTPDGMKLSEKMKYVLNMDIPTAELSRELGLNIMIVSKLRRGITEISRTRLRNASKFEEIFAKYLYTDKIELVQKDDKLITRKAVKNEELSNSIYGVLRQYRYGLYLVYDEDNDIQNMKLFNEINKHVTSGESSFNINHSDDEIDKSFLVDFKFQVTIESDKDESTFEIINHQTKTPFNLFDSSVDKRKAM